jgi:MarR family transcriptional regulator, temperature-dependent positive regulator of motility
MTMAKGKSGSKGGLNALDRSPSHLLHRALQLALDIYADEFGPGGVTQRQYAVLAAVESREGQTQTDLVRITGIDRSTLADMVARMIVKGLLERRRSDADARANSISLTAEGRVALEEARPKMAAADTRLLKLISGGKRETLTGLLRDLVKAGDEASDPAAEKPAKKAKSARSEAEKKARKADKKARKEAALRP